MSPRRGPVHDRAAEAGLTPMDAVGQAQDAIAYALSQARGDDHARLLRAAVHVMNAGKALDPRYATEVRP